VLPCVNGDGSVEHSSCHSDEWDNHEGDDHHEEEPKFVASSITSIPCSIHSVDPFHLLLREVFGLLVKENSMFFLLKVAYHRLITTIGRIGRHSVFVITINWRSIRSGLISRRILVSWFHAKKVFLCFCGTYFRRSASSAKRNKKIPIQLYFELISSRCVVYYFVFLLPFFLFKLLILGEIQRYQIVMGRIFDLFLKNLNDANGCNCMNDECDCCQSIPALQTSICLDTLWDPTAQVNSQKRI
jgi:hypothetical protein